MRLFQAGERKAINSIKRIVRRDEKLVADFDDAAIFKIGEKTFAFSTEMFGSQNFVASDATKIGCKAIAASVSDALAKGGVPRYALVSVGLPRDTSMAFLRALYKAVDCELEKYGAFIVGGDTNEARELTVSVALFSEVEHKPLPRSGARAGDAIVLTGSIGGAAAGWLMAKQRLRGPKDFLRAYQRPFLDFRLCKRIARFANAGVDVSDGLAFELGEVARESGKCITIEWEKLPLAEGLAEFCAGHGLDVRELALHSGEDYQIAYCVPNNALHRVSGHFIGRVSRGRGLFMLERGVLHRLEARGYEHFR